MSKNTSRKGKKKSWVKEEQLLNNDESEQNYIENNQKKSKGSKKLKQKTSNKVKIGINNGQVPGEKSTKTNSNLNDVFQASVSHSISTFIATSPDHPDHHSSLPFSSQSSSAFLSPLSSSSPQNLAPISYFPSSLQNGTLESTISTNVQIPDAQIPDVQIPDAQGQVTVLEIGQVQQVRHNNNHNNDHNDDDKKEDDKKDENDDYDYDYEEEEEEEDDDDGDNDDENQNENENEKMTLFMKQNRKKKKKSKAKQQQSKQPQQQYPRKVISTNHASHSSFVIPHLSIRAHHSQSINYSQSRSTQSERTPLLPKVKQHQQHQNQQHHPEQAHCSKMTSSTTSSSNRDKNDKNYSTIEQKRTPNAEDVQVISGSNEESNFFIYVITVLSAIGGFLFGYDTGIVSGAMVFIRDHFRLNEIWQEIIVSATILAAWIFSILAGSITNRMGRKFVILLASGVFTLGGFMMALASDKYILLSGRFTVGIAIGLASMVIPVYIAEVAPVSIRGRLVTINTCCITFGQFVASIIAGLFSENSETGWRWMLGLATIPSIIQMIFFFFMPESPRWLIQKGKFQDAIESLSKCRSGNAQSPHILAEFEFIKNSSQDRQDDSKGFMDILRSSSVRRAIFIGCLLMMYQQLAGINTVMYYSATIIQMSGITNKSTAVWLSALTSFINFICSFIGMVSVEKFGRRKLILLSMLGVIFSLAVLGLGFLFATIHSPHVNFHGDPNSACSDFTGCNSCVQSNDCGFCFEEISQKIQNSYSLAGTPSVNGSCVSVDPNNIEFANSSSSVCTSGTAGQWIWATMWCPSNYSWLILLGLISYLFFFAPGMGAMPWTINSEIYPLWARSFCCAASTSVNWFFNLVVSLTFLSLANALTAQGAYFLYSGIAVSGFMLFYFFLPETRGRSLEEIESIFDHPLCQIRFVKPNNQTFNNNNDSKRDSNGSVNNSDRKAIIVTQRHC